METILGVLGPIFWGLLLLSVIVGVHEGGHFLAARACGVRVTEFFLGMPCRFNLHHVSKRIGTKFGITPILLGGYAAISGMDPTKAPRASELLALVHRRGALSDREACAELGMEYEELIDTAAFLQDWGSIVCEARELPNADEQGVAPSESQEGYVLLAAPRDASGNTVFDGKRFDRAHATAVGDVWEPAMGDQAFYEQERSRTYLGQGFWKRACMLVAGVAVNIVTGFLLVIMVYSVLGFAVAINTNELGAIDAGSPAEQAGLVQGDRIVRVGETDVASWVDILQAVDTLEAGETVEVTYENADGATHATQVTLNEQGAMGISVKEEIVRLNPIDSCKIAIDNIVMTAQSVGSLLNPQHTKEVLDNSTSVVGISVMSAEAAAEGPSTFLNFAALISFSLAFMNLLPIPPLDGGKLVIEIIQSVTRREASLKVQTAISIVGVALFGLLFVYMLGVDIMRFF